MPGGFGTLDEFFEALTLTQTKKILQFPIIVFDRAFHRELLEHIEVMKQKQTISAEDLDLILVTDSLPEALDFIKKKSIDRYDLIHHRKPSPLRFLLERAWPG
jgi:predicted Rossmann-fold nucleotide-binding protein